MFILELVQHDVKKSQPFVDTDLPMKDVFWPPYGSTWNSKMAIRSQHDLNFMLTLTLQMDSWLHHSNFNCDVIPTLWCPRESLCMPMWTTQSCWMLMGDRVPHIPCRLSTNVLVKSDKVYWCPLSVSCMWFTYRLLQEPQFDVNETGAVWKGIFGSEEAERTSNWI